MSNGISYTEFKRLLLSKPGPVTEYEKNVIKDVLQSLDTYFVRLKILELMYKRRNKVEDAEYNILRHLYRHSRIWP